MKKLNESQIKRIRTAVRITSFRGGVSESGFQFEIYSYQTPGCSVTVSQNFDYDKSIQVSHSSGGKEIMKAKWSIKNITKGIKLAEKIKKIMNS